MASKYDALGEYLQSRENDAVELTFAKVDRIVGGLPSSARAHRAWWGNERDGRHTHARVWLRAGWVVEHVNLTAESVRFRRQPDGWSLVSVTRGGMREVKQGVRPKPPID